MKHLSVIMVAGCFIVASANAQLGINSVNSHGETERHDILVEKGKSLADFMTAGLLSKQQTDLNPGVEPEGDFMLRSTFTRDGAKVLLVNGNTNNVSIYNAVTQEVETMIELSGYPCDIAVNNEVAVVPCLAGLVYIISLSDYSVTEVFTFSGPGQAVTVEISPDDQFAYVAFDITDVVVKIDLAQLEIVSTFTGFPVYLLTYSWVSTGGRNTFKFSRFEVSPDGNYLIVGNAEEEVDFISTTSGSVVYSIPGIPNCFVTGLSGDGSKTIAISDYNNVLKAFQIDNTTHSITGEVVLSGQYLATFDVAVNPDGNKAFIGIGNNSGALVRFATSDYLIFTQTYTPFWLGTSPDHLYVVSGQYRLSIISFQSETMTDQYQGFSQDFGCVSPVANRIAGYDPLRYEGVYFFDFTNPADIQFLGRNLSGLPPEGDTPYRIAISPDGTRTVTSNSLSENATIINLENYSIEAIVDLGEKSDAIGITHDSQWAVMGGYDLNTIKIIDLSTNEMVTSVPTSQRPLMVSIAPDDSYAYIGNLKQNSVSFVELDGASSNEVVEIPTGVIGLSWAAFGVRSSVEVDPTGQYILVAASFEDKVQVIDIAQQQIVAELPVGSFPLKIAFNATGELAAVTNYNSDSFSILHIDGANSTVIGTYPSNGDGPLRLAYNAAADEFGILNYSTKTMIRVEPETGNINGTVFYAQYGNPIQVLFDPEGNVMVLVVGTGNEPGYLIRNNDAIVLPATPTYFDYCAETNTAVVCMPGPDYITIVEYDEQLAPIADFTANVTTIHVGQSVSFTDLTQNNPTYWNWLFEGGQPLTSTQQNPQVTYSTEGVYDVMLTAANEIGTSDILKEDYITVLPVTKIVNSEESEIISFFPNPFSYEFFIEQHFETSRHLNLSVFNAQGVLVYTHATKNLRERLELGSLPEGIYTMKICTGEKTQQIKLIKK